MGMTDAQFKNHIRFLLIALKDMDEQTDPEKKRLKFEEIIDALQKTLED